MSSFLLDLFYNLIPKKSLKGITIGVIASVLSLWITGQGQINGLPNYAYAQKISIWLLLIFLTVEYCFVIKVIARLISNIFNLILNLIVYDKDHNISWQKLIPFCICVTWITWNPFNKLNELTTIIFNILITLIENISLVDQNISISICSWINTYFKSTSETNLIWGYILSCAFAGLIFCLFIETVLDKIKVIYNQETEVKNQ